MAYDSYSDTAAPSDTKPEKKDEAEESAESSALLPKSILGGHEFKVGDEVVLKIVHMYEDQIEVEYAKEKSAEHEASEPQPEMGEMSMKE